MPATASLGEALNSPGGEGSMPQDTEASSSNTALRTLSAPPQQLTTPQGTVPEGSALPQQCEPLAATVFKSVSNGIPLTLLDPFSKGV